ncbi:integrase [Paramagnetospirillum caucaseum]|uniref:Integrase n=1 Tax=Paramagnetospirillum caucaseum TaxID=1244869 RepID=M2YEL6_9PROT|nr:tyrosine-type recombinase/integrase [Paramagnetospirillum caucaseum]EME71426.1 integrase [Paramagnetospirillum caucaseum]
MRFEMKYITETKPGHFYYRRSGRYWGRLPGVPGSVEFATEYARLNASFDAPSKAPVVPGTFDAVVTAYLRSGEYRKNLKEKTREAYRYDLDILRKRFGKFRIDDIEIKHVLKMRDYFADKPGKANTLVRTMRVVFGWAIGRGMAKRNPADLKSVNVKQLKTGAHKPWPPAALVKFRAEAPAHLVLAMELGLATGQRQGDLIRLRWDDIDSGVIHVIQEKTGKELWLPVSKALAAALEKSPKSAVTILVNSRGTPWHRANPLAQAFGDEMKRLGLDGLVFHGLRKTAAVALADVGCSTKQIAAVTGQSDQMVEHYTKGADQKRLAKAAVVKLERSQKGKC